MRHAERAEGADGIGKQRMRAIKRIDVPVPFGQARPAHRLHRPAHLEGEPVELRFECRGADLPFARKPRQIAVSADVIEPVIVDADVRNMRGHDSDRVAPAVLQEPVLARGIKFEQRRPELESLRPLRPSVRRIDPAHGEHRSSVRRVPGLVDASDLSCRKLKEALELRSEAFGSEIRIGADHRWPSSAFYGPPARGSYAANGASRTLQAAEMESSVYVDDLPGREAQAS